MLLLHHTSLILKVIIDALSVVLLVYFELDDDLKSHTEGLSDLYAIAIAAIFGFGGIAGTAAAIAKVLFFIFIAICVILFLAGLFAGRNL